MSNRSLLRITPYVWCTPYAGLKSYSVRVIPQISFSTTSLGTSAKTPAWKIGYAVQSDSGLAGWLRSRWGLFLPTRGGIIVLEALLYAAVPCMPALDEARDTVHLAPGT
ncbi:hypothetical protein VTN96DRAFT_3211 [Rasamsonia emersonii]